MYMYNRLQQLCVLQRSDVLLSHIIRGNQNRSIQFLSTPGTPQYWLLMPENLKLKIHLAVSVGIMEGKRIYMLEQNLLINVSIRRCVCRTMELPRICSIKGDKISINVGSTCRVVLIPRWLLFLLLTSCSRCEGFWRNAGKEAEGKIPGIPSCCHNQGCQNCWGQLRCCNSPNPNPGEYSCSMWAFSTLSCTVALSTW